MHEIEAHKTILAMISPFFKTMFYSTDVGNKSAKIFKIERTTAAGFQIVKDAIYNNKTIGDSLKDKSVDEVFHFVERQLSFTFLRSKEANLEMMMNLQSKDEMKPDSASDFS